MTAALLLVAGCGGGSGSGTTAPGGGTASSPSAQAPSTQTSSGQPANPPPSTVTTSSGTTPPAPRGGSPKAKSLPPLARRLSRPVSPAKTVELALSSRSPVVCALYSVPLLEKSFGGRFGCASAVRSGGRASSVKVVSARSHGDSALVVVVPQGGPSSGEKLTVSLARPAARWQLQSIRSNTPVGP